MLTNLVCLNVSLEREREKAAAEVVLESDFSAISIARVGAQRGAGYKCFFLAAGRVYFRDT